METGARVASMGSGPRWVSENKPWAAGGVEVAQTRSETMGHATEGFEVLGAAHGLGARGSVSGSGVQLGLDRTSDETRGWVHKAVVPVRTHRPRGAGGGCGGRAGDARGCLPQSGGLGTRESESVRPWHTPDSLDRGRRADIRKARGATRESVQCHGARSAEVRTRSRWRDLEIGGFSS